MRLFLFEIKQVLITRIRGLSLLVMVVCLAFTPFKTLFSIPNNTSALIDLYIIR